MKPTTQNVDTNYARDFDGLRKQQAARKAKLAEIVADKPAAGLAIASHNYELDPAGTKRPETQTEGDFIWLADHKIKSLGISIEEADEALNKKRPLTEEEEAWVAYIASPEGKAEQKAIAADCKRKMRNAGFGY